MARREFLMLCHTFDPKRHGVAMWYCSEKLDGFRAWWDGGLTRGVPADQVPFANVAKDGRYVRRPVATGLWSRYGKVIHAPDWWLDQLPQISLDGELYVARGEFQQVMSTCKDLVPGPGWQRVKFMAFDSPLIEVVLQDGEINGTNFKKRFSGISIPELSGPRRQEFESVYSFMRREVPRSEVVEVHEQEQLPVTTAAALARLDERLLDVTEAGGEGLVLRHPSSLWTPQRSHRSLKVKRLQDAEGTVTGYTWGRETDKGSKLLGMMGALVLDFRGQRLELSGFTEAEREMLSDGPVPAREIGALHPGEECDGRVHNPKFPVGSRVTFRFRELTEAGIPKEARYWRRA